MEDPVIEVKAIKLGLLGDSTVGKTAICRSLLNLDFCTDMLSTIGCDKLETKFSTKNGKQIKLCLLDSAGQERFRSMAFTALKAVHGLILVFDVSLRDSFDNINMWLELIHEKFDNPCLVLFGNKFDLPAELREVTNDEIKNFCEQKNLAYFETSAKTKQGIMEGFSHIVNEAVEKAQGMSGGNIVIDNNNGKKKKDEKSGCFGKKKKKK